MRDLVVLLPRLLVTVARLAGPGGARSVVAESVLVKHQLLVLNRSRKRSPNLRPSDRMVASVKSTSNGLCVPGTSNIRVQFSLTQFADLSLADGVRGIGHSADVLCRRISCPWSSIGSLRIRKVHYS